VLDDGLTPPPRESGPPPALLKGGVGRIKWRSSTSLLVG
jgi:hypothetical protein